VPLGVQQVEQAPGQTDELAMTGYRSWGGRRWLGNAAETLKVDADGIVTNLETSPRWAITGRMPLRKTQDGSLGVRPLAGGEL
jgi:hypothetical protein